MFLNYAKLLKWFYTQRNRGIDVPEIVSIIKPTKNILNRKPTINIKQPISKMGFKKGNRGE